METDWGLIAIRFALYADLMLLVGLAAFPLYSFTQEEREKGLVLRTGPLLMWLSVAGLPLSVFGLAISTATMMSSPFRSVDPAMLTTIIAETDLGTAWYFRLAALTAVIAGLTCFRRNQTLMLSWTVAYGAVALATLLWSGHAGATEGAIGALHRISDIAHMIAAALWIGGIAAFSMMVWPRGSALDAKEIVRVTRVLANFARIGTAAVATIIMTGLFNGLLIIGMNVSALFHSTYGWLLMAKIALFIVMLVLAAMNRWKLTPALGRSIKPTGSAPAIIDLRKSLAIEVLAAAGILALVAWLGTLAPDGAL